MYYKRKWAGHLAAHVHHMRYWVALYVHKETRMAAVKRAEKSDLEDVFKKVNTTIGGRGGGEFSSAVSRATTSLHGHGV